MYTDDLRKQIPSVEKLNQLLPEKFLGHPIKGRARTELIRLFLSDVRNSLSKKESAVSTEDLVKGACTFIESFLQKGISRVINATGIVLHTNLGRAPLGKDMVQRVADELYGYCSLEIDTETGARGSRDEVVENYLKVLTGCEAACVVNNNAAAVYLMLFAIAKGKKVVLSRGELIQIGGGFRMPDIMESTGAHLVEVGTTNITYLSDYEKAIDSETRLVLKVHPSNFEVKGHTEEVSIADLRGLCDKKKIPLAFDLGHGLLHKRKDILEQSVEETIRAGVDIVCVSGDKLLGGLQAGILLGKKEWIDLLRKHPLYRSMRIHKVELFVLETLLRQQIQGTKSPTETLMDLSIDQVKVRAEGFSKQIDKVLNPTVVEGMSPIGGGTTPSQELPTYLIRLQPADVEECAAKLRSNRPAVICRLEKKSLWIDLRTVFAEEEVELLKALKGIC